MTFIILLPINLDPLVFRERLEHSGFSILARLIPVENLTVDRDIYTRWKNLTNGKRTSQIE